jgi:multidrug efflux pump subunit AcrB
MAIASNNSLQTADQFAALVIATRNGPPVFLRDVAMGLAG